ncbi:restriction endonuclease subunit S [Acinetobacter johnsonii]|uniref:restriction endonuclease subunit S n=1 Tax=Acinetobacter johnsonii TaxID=40214 RepID=UPI0022067067|nr:restriction endonuclease subunit S [Acinetobacter johnsonii]
MAAPKLRFKEFDNDWINTKVKDLGEFSSGGTPSKDIHDYWNGNIPWISSSDLNEESIFDIRINRFISEDAIKNSATKKIPKNSILLVSRVGVGKVALTNQELCTSQDFTALTPKKDYALFIAYLMKNITPRLLDLNQGTSIKGFVREDLISLPISLPSKEEQTKIASFLSAVDEKISQLTQKHELLNQYKQGMMQKLFSQEIRFKADDGREFGEWEEKTLIDSVDTNIKWSFTGGPFGSNLKSEDYTELGIRIIQLQNIGDGAFLNDYKIYTSPEKANELLSCNIYPDEILISKMGDPVARCCIVPKHHDRYVMCSDGIRLVVDKQNYSSIFMFYQINYQDFRQSASDVSTGSTRKRIGLSDLKQLPIKVPCLEEQTKIANFLSAIDQKIEVVAQQIEQAKQWKKGLLQQMFV